MVVPLWNLVRSPNGVGGSMPVNPISFGTQSRPGRFGPDGGARLFNCYAEALKEAKSPYALYCRPGLVEFATLSGGAFRGAIELEGNGYVVNGTSVDKVDATGTVTSIGSFAGDGPVFMCRNRKSPDPQVIMVSDGLRALITADVVSSISDTDLPAPVSVDSIGGYAVFAIEDGRYFWTSIDDASAIDALDFASAEANPDGLNCIKSRGQEIILFGPQSIEFHALTGSSNTFDRVQQTTLDIGCLAGSAVQSLNGVVIFPASDTTVRRLNGYSPERISNNDVERSIDALDDKSTLRAFTYQREGHQFYILTCTSFTWACDLSSGLWFEWNSYGLDHWRARGMLELGGKKLVGDFENAKLFELDPDANDDDGDYLVMRVRSAATGQFPGRFIADELSVDMLVGVGTATETNPRVLLRTSTDGGRSWSSEISRPLGPQASYKRNVNFRQLGSADRVGMIFELTVSAAVARAIQGAALRYTPLNN